MVPTELLCSHPGARSAGDTGGTGCTSFALSQRMGWLAPVARHAIADENDAPSQEITEDVRENRQVEPAPCVQDSPEWLSTNPDHSSEDSASAQSLATILRNDDPALQCCLQNTHAFLEDQIAGPLSSPPDLQATDERRPPLALWSINPDHLRHREAIHANPEDLPDEVELAVYPPMTVTIPDLPAEFAANSFVVYMTSISDNVRRELLSKDDHHNKHIRR